MTKAKIIKHTASYHDELIHALKNSKQAHAYLQVAMSEYQEDGSAEALLVALRNVVEAYGGMTQLARKTHLNRQSLYHALSKKGNPTLATFGLILKELGFRLTIQRNLHE